MKYIKPKDIVDFLAFGLGMVVLIVLAGFLETAPLGITMWVAVVVGLALWIVWAILTIRERRPRLMVWIDGRGWVDAEKYSKEEQADYKELFLDANLRAAPTTRREAKLFDQDAAAIDHLDFNKENA